MALITLSDAKPHLGIPTGVTTFDTELQGFVDAAQTVVEDIAGVIVQRTITGETHDGGGPSIVTLYSPVITVTSLKEYVGTSAFTLTSQPLGATVDNYGYELVDQSGVIVRRGAAGVVIPFQGGRDGVVISYTCGFATVPPAIRLGALELVRHWWQRSQQGGRPGFNSMAGEDGYVTVGSYLVPNFVAELLASNTYSSRRLPGIA